MQFVGSKIVNHPQQVKVRGADDSVDERITPADLYASFNARYGFTLDVAASGRNAKTQRFYDRPLDGLKQAWAPDRVWCNPPWSNLSAWMFKAHHEMEAGCPVIVVLLPNNRTEQPWWQRFVEPYRDRPNGLIRAEFIARRRNFGVPGNEAGIFKTSPGYGLVALIMGAHLEATER
jgi:phage N-6-adenine-methyltransferase